METDLAKTAQYWSNPVIRPPRIRWWESKTIVRHINRNICGIPLDNVAGGDSQYLKAVTDGQAFAHAVSVGCGAALHEIHLIQSGAVKHFDLYEIAPKRIEAIWENAEKAGVVAQIRVMSGSPFSNPPLEQYDLVYWKDALHHMNPTLDAICWSRKVLKTGGSFYMNECVGPSYMQWTDRQLDIAEKIRNMLPERYLANPHQPGHLISLRRHRPTIKFMRENDPSECVDSSNILPSLVANFPNVHVIPTGGVVYTLALADILANFKEKEDEGLLNALMALDDMYSEKGDYLHAVAHAKKLDPAADWV